MGLMTPEAYVQSLADLRLNIYLMGGAQPAGLPEAVPGDRRGHGRELWTGLSDGEGAMTQGRLWANNPRKFTREDMERVYRNMAVRPGSAA